MLLTLISLAAAYIDPDCQDEAAQAPPDWYEGDEAQNNFLLNYFALATTLSPTHAPIPVQAGHGTMGLELAVIPALSCDRRLVLNRTKTEDTNKAPIAPRPRITFAFPKVGPFVFYGGLGYIPPVTVFQTRNVIASGEAGVGVSNGDGLQGGLRYHYTMIKTVAEIATPFEEGGEAYDDVYIGSTFGVDGMIGHRFGPLVPYLSAGFTDVSTFFWIGDDSYYQPNTDPYFGAAISAGVQLQMEKFDAGAEFYTAPGYIYTGRFRFAYKI